MLMPVLARVPSDGVALAGAALTAVELYTKSTFVIVAPSTMERVAGDGVT